MSDSVSLFFAFRIIQTRLMLLSIIVHGLNPNQKLKAILKGCANLDHLWGSTLEAHQRFSQAFFLPQSVYIRFTHIHNFQPKFYLGSALHHVLDREYSRTRKYYQLTHDRLVQAELALRYWREHQNLFIWAPIPLFTCRTDFRCLELALIQEWQPRLNYPFICQFFHPKKGLLKRPAMNTNAQFGLATLCRRARHRFTPSAIKAILASDRFQNRLHLWNLIHDLGSNTKARFNTTRLLRSQEGGLHLCYALRRLATNIQEPYRTLSLQAIDSTIAWWKGKPAPRASALRAPWAMSPNLAKTLQGALRQWYFQMIAHHVPCHIPSFKTIFVKHSSVVDFLCNHKSAIESWSLAQTPHAAAPIGPPFALQPSIPHRTTGSYRALHSHLCCPQPSLFLLKVPSRIRSFPRNGNSSPSSNGASSSGADKMAFHPCPNQRFGYWAPNCHLSHLTNHITRSSIQQLEQLFPGAVFHCEDKHASSLRIFCPCLYHQAIEKTFLDPEVFAPIPHTPQYITSTLVDHLLHKYGRSYPWAIGKGRQLPSGYILAKKKRTSPCSGRPIISFVDAPFRPMLNILARLLFQLIPIACPDHFATGDVYHLLHILRQAPEHGPLRLYNQDLAGFFTSIDQQRVLGAWSMLLDLLRPHTNVSDTEVFSVYPGRFNNPETSSKDGLSVVSTSLGKFSSRTFRPCSRRR